MENKKLTIPEMLIKLDNMYNQEQQMIAVMTKLRLQYKQLKDDIEMLQTMIMYASNKTRRG